MDWVSHEDSVAVLVALALWVALEYTIEYSPWAKSSLTAAIAARRIDWMRAAASREVRIVDSALLGNVMHSISFLASASLIILGVVGAALGAVGRDIEAVQNTFAFLPAATAAQVETKLALVGVIFVYIFLNLTWSLQQFNFCCIMLGAAPRETEPESVRNAFADRIGRLASRGGRSFNHGLRGFYYALAGVGWFIHPLALIGAALLVTAILLRREYVSVTRRELVG